MNRLARVVLTRGSWLILGALFLSALCIYAGLAIINNSNRSVDHSREILIEVQAAFSYLEAAESAQRGFLLTAHEPYLEYYESAEPNLFKAIERLRNLTRDNPTQLASIAEFERVAKLKLAELESTIALQRSDKSGAAREIVLTGLGKSLMDQARKAADSIRDEDGRLLRARSEQARWAIWSTGVTFTATIALTLFLYAAVAALQRREAKEKARADAALRESEAWFSTTLKSIGDALIATDDQGRIRLLNPVAESLTGWSQTEAVGKPIEEVFHIVNEMTRAPAEHPVIKVIREGIVVGLANHTVLIAKGGGETPIEDSAAPIRDAFDRIRGVVMVFRDVTETRHADVERERLLAEALEANQAKSRFLAILSHELRTPLNPILLAVSSMIDRPVPPAELPAILAMIRHNVNLQARLIDDLLDVMRIVQGKMPLHWGVADCHEIIQHAIQVCQSEIFGKSIQLSVELNAESHYVSADSARLEQVFWNLIKNAVKFTPEGGRITIRSRLEPRSGDRDPKLLLEFHDTGIGIDAEALTRIFDPFQQAETSTTRKFGGLGLGLAICKGVIDAHGGTIEVQSGGKDLGTTFKLTLVALASPPALPELSPQSLSEGASSTPVDTVAQLKILVVEDEEATRRLMARLLQRLGHEVAAAGSVAEAVEFAQSANFDLIVSDIGLPDGSGLDLMRRIVALRGEVTAIALTGYGMEDDIIRSRQAGFTTHMTKPIDFNKLEAMIRQVVR